MIKVLITPPLFLLPLLCFGFCTGGKPALPIISAKHYKNPVPIIVERDSLTLIWSRPDTNYNLIDYYELFYRNDTVSEVNLLATHKYFISLYVLRIRRERYLITTSQLMGIGLFSGTLNKSERSLFYIYENAHLNDSPIECKHLSY
jgi:hypothetical protein